MEPKILVASPTFHGMGYCFDRFINSIKSLEYSNFDILIVDNSDSNNFFDELEKAQGIIKIKFNPDTKDRYTRLIESRNRILSYAKENNYDYILMMDSDVIPPRDILKKLLSHDKDLVSGVYYNYFTVSKKVKWLTVAWKLLTLDEFSELKSKVNISSHLNREDCPRHLTEEEIKSGELLEVFHPSAGCLLISKNVFQKLNYLILKKGEKLLGDDVAFIQNCRIHGFKCWCDCSILCEHLVEGKFGKDKAGNLIHPLAG